VTRTTASNASEKRRHWSHLVRAYHCTRLTYREVRNVRYDGLRLLTPELVQRRLQDAVTDGLRTPDEAAFYGRTKLPQDPH
jgi:hypothetical protein